MQASNRGPTAARASPARAVALSCSLCLGSAHAVAADTSGLRLYEMTTQTGMPHLEENLRYAVVRETRCLDPRDLRSAFWMLRHESLQDCRLEPAATGRADALPDATTYTLLCSGGHGTTGSAVWQFEPGRLSGTLNVRLGGKNMTFHQRITATQVGACSSP